jgi:L-seryl-tRNA(Ser) seleniumtransferase
MPGNVLRNLPSMGELLDSPPLRSLIDRVSHNAVVSGVRTFLDEVRGELQTAATDRTLPSVSELAERIARRILADEHTPLVPLINATGRLWSPALGGAPLADSAIAELAAVARDYSSLEVNLATGARSSRDDMVTALLKELTECEAAFVASSAAAATMLALAALAAGREVAVSRSQLIETDDGVRVTELIASSGAVLREVGSVNVTRSDDYSAALQGNAAAILCLHSSLATPAQPVSPTLAELAQLSRRSQLPLLYDLGWGGLELDPTLGVSDLPTVKGSLQSGVSLAIFRGDRMLGGPTCGIVAGNRELIGRVRRHPLSSAVQADKLTLAALGATLRIHRDNTRPHDEIPLLQLLSTSAENLKQRVARMAPQMEASPGILSAEAVAGTTQLGTGTWCFDAATWSIALSPVAGSAEQLAARLRRGFPAVVGRVDDGRVWLDLRSVFPRQDRELVAAVCAAASQGEQSDQPAGEDS